MYTKAFTQLSIACRGRFDLIDLSEREFLPRSHKSASIDGVVDIVFLATDAKMVRIAAGGVVARMKNASPIGYRCDEFLECVTVRRNRFAAALHSAVTVTRARSRPVPATRFLVKFEPIREALDRAASLSRHDADERNTLGGNHSHAPILYSSSNGLSV